MPAGPESDSREPDPTGPAPARRGETWLAAAACLLLALLWGPPVSMERSWGWDEVMHAELPAARMLVAAREGRAGEAAAALLDCQQYPFVYPLVLAAGQGLGGPSERAARVTGRLVWCAGLFGLFVLGRALVRGRGTRARGRGDALVPWLCLALGAASPLALAYSGSLFLEVPFATLSIWALVAWLRRDADAGGGGAARELLAGLAVTACFFAKFNYGVLLALGLGLDLAVEGLGAARAGRAGAFARRTAWLAAWPTLALAWWFLLPFPEGAARAAIHREAFAEFLGGNRDASMRTPGGYRVLHALCFLAFTPRVMLLQGVGLARTLGELRARPVRLLWIVLLAGGLPVWTHPFHLDRFLIPGAVPLWCLAALGLARLLPAAPSRRAFALAGLALACLLFPRVDARLAVARTIGLADDPGVRAAQERVLASWQDLTGDRAIETAGLARGEHDALVDRIAPALGPDESLGWIGVNSSFPPAALQLALLQRGGSAERFLRDAPREAWISIGFADPGLGDDWLRRWAGGFDAILASEPHDFRADPRRAWVAGYRDRLASAPGWARASLGQVELTRGSGERQPVELLVLRRP